MFKCTILRWERHVARMELDSTLKSRTGKRIGKRPVGRPWRR